MKTVLFYLSIITFSLTGNLKAQELKVLTKEEYKNGFTGKAKGIFTENNYYEGEWKDSKFHGYGKRVYENGNIYEGYWENDKFHGEGRYTFSEGGYVEGNWIQDLLNGYGKQVYASGNSYEGDFVNSVFHGKGTYIYYSKYTYVGDFENGSLSGYGKMTFTSGAYCEGEFANDFLNGKGIYKYSDGSYYEGEFVDDVRHGKGTLTYANGKTVSGTFVNGNFKPTYGECSCTFEPNGNSRGKSWYNGVLTYSDGTEKEFSLEVRIKDNTDNTFEFFDFNINGSYYYFKWNPIDIGDSFNSEGKLQTKSNNDKLLFDVKLGYTTSGKVAMKWMLKEMFGSDCSSFKHDYNDSEY